MGLGHEWVVKTKEPVLQRILARQLGVSPLLAQLLINRGFYTVGAAKSFLEASLQDLHHPLLMHDMDKAVRVIKEALTRDRKILIYGDYDVDGITGTVFLVDLLRRLGGDVDYYIPNRIKDGYGLNEAALTSARAAGVDLIITVDCGISAVEEVDAAQKNGGPQIIITDHHQPPETLPDATAIINPKQPDCQYPFKELAGVGVAFKLGQALLNDLGKTDDGLEYLDLVCLGTVADIVSLQGENRILVRHGLKQLNQSPRPGVRALCRVAGVKQEDVDTGKLGFTLAPRLNAAGRLGDAAVAVELLLAGSDEVAATLADTLNQKNQQRQGMEADIIAEAVAMIESDAQLADDAVLVLASDHWHPGVIGIVAARLVDRYGKPVLLIACEQNQGKGSARSVPGFNLYQALEHCGDLLEGYGGHAMAAGFSVSVEKIKLLTQKINQYAHRHFADIEKKPMLEIDALVALDDLTLELVDEIKRLAPFGQQNPNPLFGMQQTKLLYCQGVGQQKAHLKMLLGNHQLSVDGIGFNLGSYAGSLNVGSLINVAFAPTINKWQGKTSLQINVKDLKQDDFTPTPAAHRQLPGEKQLLAAGDLMFVPETILGLLHNLIQSRELDLPLPMRYLLWSGLLNHQDGLRCQYPHGYTNNIVSQLMHENFKHTRTLLVVSSVCHMVQLVKYIDGCDGGLKQQQFCVHGFMPPELVQKTVQEYAEKPHGMLLITFNCLPYLQDFQFAFDRVLVAQPPMLANDWTLLQQHVLNGSNANTNTLSKLEVLYTHKAWVNYEKHWRELAPDRKMLALYYTILKTSAHNGRGLCDKAMVQRQMARQGYPLISWLSLAVAAAVFADLGLLQYQWQQNKLNYQLQPTHGTKKDLSHSPIFTQVHLYKKQGLDWLQQNMTQSITANGT